MKNQRLSGGILAAMGMLLLILDGKTAVEGAQAGVELCLQTVIPSLFPFFMLSILVTGAFSGADSGTGRLLGKLFLLPAGSESVLIPGFLGGYPAGAQCIGEAYRRRQLDENDAERMLSFCSNAGPAFLFGMVSRQFPKLWMVWALWGIQIASALCVARVFPPGRQVRISGADSKINLADAMASSVSIMMQVCGWVILFRVWIAFLERWFLWLLPAYAKIMLIGLLELSNGCCMLVLIENLKWRFLICAGLLSWGGLCVTMQTGSAAKGLSLKYYILGKLIQGLLSITFAAAIVFEFFWIVPCIVIGFLGIYAGKRKNSRFPIFVGV